MSFSVFLYSNWIWLSDRRFGLIKDQDGEFTLSERRE